MKSLVHCCATIATVTVICTIPVARALDKTQILTLDLARKMAAGCEAKAKEMNWKMNISVVDSGANQIFSSKKWTALLRAAVTLPFTRLRRQRDFRSPLAVFRSWPTARISRGAWCQGLRWFLKSLRSLADCRIVTEDKVHIGGIGVSGGTSDQDEMCAQAGIDTIKDSLK